MFSRIPERKMRYVRTGLLIAWFVLVGSLFWDPLTPLLTMPDNVASPFHLPSAPVMVQGKPLPAGPYAMGNLIFWGMVLPLIPLFMMVFGHEAWRRVCPLSYFSQIPYLLGWQRKLKVLNRRSGRVDRVLALLPEVWLRRSHYYSQFGFLTLGICARILFDNSNRIALVGVFAFILGFALVIGLLYGGKTWCSRRGIAGGVLMPRRPVRYLQGHASRRHSRTRLRQWSYPGRRKGRPHSRLPGAPDRPCRGRCLTAAGLFERAGPGRYPRSNRHSPEASR